MAGLPSALEGQEQGEGIAGFAAFAYRAPSSVGRGPPHSQHNGRSCHNGEAENIMARFQRRSVSGSAGLQHDESGSAVQQSSKPLVRGKPVNFRLGQEEEETW